MTAKEENACLRFLLMEHEKLHDKYLKLLLEYRSIVEKCKEVTTENAELRKEIYKNARTENQ